MEGKRTLNDIILTIGVGAGMATNVTVCTEKFYRLGEKIAPRVSEYIGSIGSGAIEYGLPALAFLLTACLGIVAVRATDQYLLNRDR